MCPNFNPPVIISKYLLLLGNMAFYLFALLLAGICLVSVDGQGSSPFFSGLGLPSNAAQLRNWKPSNSMLNPNVATNVDYSIAANVDEDTGKINLAGGKRR